MVAHAGTPDEAVAQILFIAAGALGWVAVTRLRGRSFARLPLAGAWALAALAVAALTAAVVVPSLMSPTYSSARPRSPATLTIVSPRPNEVVTGDRMRVDLLLEGGRLTDTTTTRVTPTTGHLHVSIDGQLLSMTSATDARVDISELADGEHLLEADFVAADHGPFRPPVTASVPFDKESR
jgi:hypothetical protein